MATEKRTFKIKDGVSVTEEVVATIAGLSATEVEGVASLEGNLGNKVIEKVGYTSLSKGVKVIQEAPGELIIRLSVNTEFGQDLQTVCKGVQKKVKTTVETMTGMKVTSVDVKISSVVIENAN